MIFQIGSVKLDRNQYSVVLCTVLMCPQNIANGHTVDCDRLPGSVCVYTCNNGYQPATQPPSLACLPGLVWNVSTDSLCVGL